MTTYPDPLPFKLRAMRALTDILKSITPDEGYVYDLSDFVDDDGVTVERVYRGRDTFGEGDPLPMVSILEGVNPGDDVAEPPVEAVTGEYDWDILIQGWLPDDQQHPTDPAYLLLADVRQRLIAERSRKLPGTHQPDPLGLEPGKNRVVGIRVGAGVVRPPDRLSDKAWFWLTLTLRIVDNAAEPYA